MRCKSCLYITGTIVAATITIAIINRRKKKKEIDQIVALLDPVAASKASGNAFSPNYWRDLNRAGKIKMGKPDADRAQANAKIIYDSLGYFQSDDDQRVIDVFSSLNSQVDVSMIADAFQTNYKKDFKEHLSHLSDSNFKKVQKIISQLKPY